MNTMHVDDFVVLGRTVPEESKKYGKRVCMAGYSQGNNQFIRVYPLMVPVGAHWNANSFRARHSYSMDLKRNPGDNRFESWRVQDELRPTETLWDRAPEVTTPTVLNWLLGRRVDSIRTLNECRMSLGVLLLKAEDWEGLAEPRDSLGEDEEHVSLFEDLRAQDEPDLIADRVKYAPYIRFRDASGEHRLQVREWGAYLLLSKPDYADSPEALWQAAGYRRGQDLVVVIGNMNNRRNNWLIIKTFERARESPGLFDSISPD